MSKLSQFKNWMSQGGIDKGQARTAIGAISQADLDAVGVTANTAKTKAESAQASAAQAATDAATASVAVSSFQSALSNLAGTISGKLSATANLSDLSDKNAAKTALGLKGAAMLDVGTTAGTVADGLALANEITARQTNKAKLDTLPWGISKGSVAIPTLALLASQDVTVTFIKAMPDANYDISYDIFGQGLGNMKLAIKTKTAVSVVLTVTAIAALTGGGTINVTATDLSY